MYVIIMKFINVSSPHIISTFWWLVCLKSALLIQYLSFPLWLISLTRTRSSHGYTCVPPLLNLPAHVPPHPIPLGLPSAPALSTLSHASSLDWRSVSHMVIYMFQCYSLKSSHPRLLPQRPKVCSLHLCLFAVVCLYFLFQSKMRLYCVEGRPQTLTCSPTCLILYLSTEWLIS